MYTDFGPQIQKDLCQNSKNKNFHFSHLYFFEILFLFVRIRACFLVLAHTTCPPMTIKGRIRLCDEEQGSNDNWFPSERLATVYNCCECRSALPDKKLLIRHNKK